MTIFKTTPDQQLEVYKVATKMAASCSVSTDFIARAVEVALYDQGVFDLFVLWVEAETEEDRAATIADIQVMVDDVSIRRDGPIKKPKINFANLSDVVKDVKEFKKKLRDLIDQRGGITALAQKTGIPQPSLSRLFTSGSMPRRTTLYKIAEALDLEENDIVTEWARD